MIDTATNWFYAERRLSAGAAIEDLRHELWAWGYYNVLLRLVRSEPPFSNHSFSWAARRITYWRGSNSSSNFSPLYSPLAR